MHIFCRTGIRTSRLRTSGSFVHAHTMQRVVRLSSVAAHGQHGWEDCAAMQPDERVAHLLRMCERMFAGQTNGLLRVAHVRKLRRLRPTATRRAHN